jgi:26S proteasome regulatory subunit N1
VSYVPEPDDMKLLKTSLEIYRKFDRHPEAMRIAIQLNDVELIKDVFLSCRGRYGIQEDQFQCKAN